MINYYSSITKGMISGKSFDSKHFSTLYKKILEMTNGLLQQPWILATLLVFCFSFTGYSQKKSNGNSNKNNDIVPVLYCVKNVGNGIYQASFGYKNPTRKEVVIDEDGSIVKTNNGKKVAKGLNKFKPGSVDKAFNKIFGSGDYVEWTIISNGNSHTVIANANSAKNCAPEDGFIFPVYGGDGKYNDLIGSKLGSLSDGTAGDNPSDLIYQINNQQKVLIEIVPNQGNTLDVINKLQNVYGLTSSDFLIDPSVILAQNLTTIDVSFPISELTRLNEEILIINFVRPLYPSFQNNGITTTQVTVLKKQTLFGMLTE